MQIEAVGPAPRGNEQHATNGEKNGFGNDQGKPRNDAEVHRQPPHDAAKIGETNGEADERASRHGGSAECEQHHRQADQHENANTRLGECEAGHDGADHGDQQSRHHRFHGFSLNG